MIKIKQSGNFKNTEKLLTKTVNTNYLYILEKYGQEGVKALALNTPIDSGLTASSWSYKIRKNKGSLSIIWSNSNVVNGVSIAIIIQYGHATRNGGYVEGRDYINPALQPVFDKMANEVWGEVTR